MKDNIRAGKTFRVKRKQEDISEKNSRGPL